jgi:hypothetical protein
MASVAEAGQLEVADRGRPISGIGRPHLLSENRNRKASDLNGLACSSLTTSIWSDQPSARFQIWTGVFFRANATKQGGASVPRFLLSLTEFQSHVTRKMPALNNAKPDFTKMTHLARHSLSHAVRRIVKDKKLAKFTPHDLRGHSGHVGAVAARPARLRQGAAQP